MSRPNHSRFRLYLLLEIKKYRLALPKICAGLCLILFLSTSFLLLYQRYLADHQDRHRIQIGICANPDEPYLDWMIQTIEHMEELKFSCQFEFVSEEKGIKRLQDGKYTALFLIPQNYIQSLIEGKEAILRIRFRQGQASVADYLVKELGNAASGIMLDTEAGIYALQDYYQENHWSGMSKDELTLNIRYLQKVLQRKEIYAYEEIPAMGTITDQTHYTAVAILCFLTAFGITCSALLRREPDAFIARLQQSGLPNWKRILAKETAMLLCFTCLYLALSLLLAAASPWIPGFCEIVPSHSASPLQTVLLTGMKLITITPVLLVICSSILWVFEIVSHNFTSILVLFISFLCLAFLSGYFYPLSYFPDSIQRISSYLPTRVILDYCYHRLNGSQEWTDLILILLMSGILFGSLVYITDQKRRRSY